VQDSSVQNYASPPVALRGSPAAEPEGSTPLTPPPPRDVTLMLTAVAALLLLILLAATVTVMDAVRAAHWRLVAVERRRSWDDRIAGDAAR
jgi:hypothetical protein